MRVLDGNGIEEGEFKNFEMDLIIPSQYSGSLDYIEKFLNVDVTSFLQSSRDFVVQGEMLKLFLVLQPPQNGTPAPKLAPKVPKDELSTHTQPSIGYHVDVRLRNPEDYAKASAATTSSLGGGGGGGSKVTSKSIMISNPKHGHVRHTPKLNSEYDTETANQLMDTDTAYSSGSEATATSTSSLTATSTSSLTATSINSPNFMSTLTATSTPINSPATATPSTSFKDHHRDGANAAPFGDESSPKGLLADFVVINSPAGATKAKNGSKPNFFRLPDGTIIFPIEIPVGVKSKYNNKDISVVVSVARVMQPPAVGPTSGRLLNENLHLPFPGSSSTAHHHVTSATKLEKLLSTQYPQYWQYSQYSRGGIGSILSPSFTEPKASIHSSHSNPNLVALGSSLGSLGSSSLTRTSSILNNATMPAALPTYLTVNTLSNANSRSDPNIASLASSQDTLSLPVPPSPSSLLPPSVTMSSRGSSGNLYGMGQLHTSTSSATLNFANIATATGQTGSTTNSNLSTNLGVSSGAPVAIKTAQKIVRVLEPLQVRLLQHYAPTALKLGTKRLIPVAVSNTHPTLPIIVRGLQLVLSNIPSLEGGNAVGPGPGTDTSYTHVSVTDKYKTSTLDIETFPVTVLPGDEYHFVVSVEPTTPSTSSSSSSSFSSSDPSLPPPSTAPPSRVIGISTKRRIIYTLQAQLVITWSIPCSPGSILSLHPLPVTFPAPHDLLVSFDSKSPVRAHNIFNVCFTITNLSDYSRELTFIIPRPVCVTGSRPPSSTLLSSSSSSSSGSLSSRSLPRSPPARANTLPTIRYTPSTLAPSASSSSLASPSRVASAQNVHQSASTSLLPPSSALNGSGSIPPPSPRAVLPNDVTVDEEELLVRFGELQANSASMLCLEKTLYVGLVKSNSSVSVNVRYIPMREGLFEIQGLQIFDRANDQMYVVQDNCQLYVIA